MSLVQCRSCGAKVPVTAVQGYICPRCECDVRQEQTQSPPSRSTPIDDYRVGAGVPTTQHINQPVQPQPAKPVLQPGVPVAASVPVVPRTTNCPYCQTEVTNDGSLAGQAVSCPRCGNRFEMPAPIAQSQSAPQPQLPQSIVSQNVVVQQHASDTNTFGVISVCLAVLGLFTCGFACLPGFVCAIIGLGTQPNGTAIVGLIFNGLVAVPMFMLLAMGVLI